MGTLITASAKEPLAVGAHLEAMTRGFGGKLYISMMGEPRTEGDGDGGITVIEDGVPNVFCDGMDDTKGIVQLGDFLVTTDFRKLWKIDAEGNKEVLAASEDFPNSPLFLNDVVFSPDGKSILLTDMGDKDR